MNNKAITGLDCESLLSDFLDFLVKDFPEGMIKWAS